MDPCLLQGPPINARYVRFGSLQIDQQRQRAMRDGKLLPLQGKTFDALMVLLQKQRELVTREELKRALWSTEVHVNRDANLNTTVNKLRRVLGEITDKVSCIETIPRKGYRFTGTAEFSDIPFAEMKPANSTLSETIDPDRQPEARERELFRFGKSLTVIIVALFLAGMLIGATAATFWISRVASRVRHSALKESRYLSVRGTC